MLTTYYPNDQPYIVEDRVNGIRNGEVKIYNATGQLINKMEYSNLQIYYIEYWQNDLRHNLHDPACIGWSTNGKIYRISYWQNGIRHNLHGPAFMYWSDGQIYSIKYYYFGKLIKEYEF